MSKVCGEPTPDRTGRSCDKPRGHDGDHWTYAGHEKTWSQLTRAEVLEQRIERMQDDITNLRNDVVRWQTLHDEVKADLDKTTRAWAEAADERDLRRGERDGFVTALQTIAKMKYCRDVPSGPTRDLHVYACPYCAARDAIATIEAR